MGEIIFSYMPHAPSPAVAIQTATQVAHMGRSFCMFLRSILIEYNVYIVKTIRWSPPYAGSAATRRGGITAGGAMACGEGDVLVLALELTNGKLVSPENETRRFDLRNAESTLLSRPSIASISPCATADACCLVPPRLAIGLCC